MRDAVSIATELKSRNRLLGQFRSLTFEAPHSRRDFPAHKMDCYRRQRHPGGRSAQAPSSDARFPIFWPSGGIATRHADRPGIANVQTAGMPHGRRAAELP